jgi:hypothetical protein
VEHHPSLTRVQGWLILFITLSRTLVADLGPLRMLSRTSVFRGEYSCDTAVCVVVLKLYSDKDLLPGLEIRLLPHQLIGVSWYEVLCVFFSRINRVAQDGRPGEKNPPPGWYFSVGNF